MRPGARADSSLLYPRLRRGKYADFLEDSGGLVVDPANR